MNILFDAGVMNGHFVGIAKSLYYLYYHCHRLCDDFCAFGFNSIDQKEYPEAGIRLIGQRNKRELLSFAEEHNIDIVHYPANFIRRPVLSGLKTVLTVHDLIPYEEKNYFSNWLEKSRYVFRTRYGLKKADLVTTVSEYSGRAIHAFSGGKILPKVIYWGVTLPHTFSRTFVPDYRYFLYVGGYDRRKGIERLVDAFMYMKHRGLTECKLVLAEKPSPLNPETDRMIREGVEEGYIVQTGYVDDESLCSLYAHAVCEIYLSNMEGFGLPVIEAMQYGCPVITTKRTSLPEIGGEAACYVDRDNKTEIIKMLSRMEEDPAFRDSCIRAGKVNLARFGWDISARAFLEALESL